MKFGTGSPEFHRAMKRYVELVEGGMAGELVTALALKEAVNLAPPEFLDLCCKVMAEAGIKLPTPVGLDARGRRVYRLDDVAKACGLSQEEAERAYEELGIESPNLVTRVQ